MLKWIRQYVYVPPDTPKFQVQQLSNPHTDPKTFQTTNQSQGEVSQQVRKQGYPATHPIASRFTPATGSKAQFPNKGTMGQAFPRQTNMGPPPTPQRFHSNTTDNHLVKNRSSTNHPALPPSRRQKLQNTDTTIPGTSHQQPSNAPSQRFFQTSSTSNPRGSNSRPSLPSTMRGEHRMPFVPEGAVSQQGFG